VVFFIGIQKKQKIQRIQKNIRNFLIGIPQLGAGLRSAGGKNSRVCLCLVYTLCMPARFKLISEVSLLLIRDGKVCLLRRSNTGYEDGKYCFIAGHKDEGETLVQAMVREAAEEAGIIIKPENLTLALAMDRFDQDERLAFFFAVNEWEGEPRNLEPEKHDDMSWFPVDALPENMVPYMRFALEQVRAGRNYAEFGW
jgi:8-oxo-dGTP diphosphatase